MDFRDADKPRHLPRVKKESMVPDFKRAIILLHNTAPVNVPGKLKEMESVIRESVEDALLSVALDSAGFLTYSLLISRGLEHKDAKSRAAAIASKIEDMLCSDLLLP